MLGRVFLHEFPDVSWTTLLSVVSGRISLGARARTAIPRKGVSGDSRGTDVIALDQQGIFDTSIILPATWCFHTRYYGEGV